MYRWGIIGTGRIAHTFAEALNGAEGAQLYAVASRTLQKARAFAEEFGAQAAFGSYEELAGDENIDVVYIATPMSSHFNDAMLCLDKGKNVLCEKSVTLNSSQLEILLEKAAAKGLFFMEAMWMKCRPTYLKALEWAQSGRLGKVRYIKADFCNLVPFDKTDRLFAPECGGGALLDLGVYPLTLALDHLGEPDEIQSAAHMRDGIDMSDAVTLKYKDGSFAAINCGFEIPNRNNAVIVGDKGSAVFGDWFFCSCEVTLYDENGREAERSVIPNEINGYEYEIREVHRCLDQGLTESFLVPFESTRAVMKVMDTCRKQWGFRYPDEDS